MGETEGKIGSCSGGQGHAQENFNTIFYWWVGLCSFPVIYLGANYKAMPKNAQTTTQLHSSHMFISVQSLSRVRIFATPWTAAHQAFLSITNSQSLHKLMSIESVMPSKHVSVVPFSSCPQSFQHQGLFQWVSSSHQVAKYCSFASASVLPTNTQDWSPLGWTGWISLQSKGLSIAFSNTTVQNHQFFSTQLSL